MSKIKALFLAANPTITPLLALDREMRLIEEKVGQSYYRGVLDFRSAWATRPDDLLVLLNQHRPHIVHFSGHGTGPGILLEEENGEPKLVSTLALKELFAALKDNIRLVMLNACYSHKQARGLKEVIDCVIGMNDPIGDEAAAVFSSSFYRAIGFGRSIQNAFDQGKASLKMEGIPEGGIPKLLFKKGVDPNKIILIAPGSTAPEGRQPVDLFISCADNSKDQDLRDQLVRHLSNLRNQGLIRDWHNGVILPGAEWKKETQQHLAQAQIILLLISSDYMSSDFYYSVEMQQAISRHQEGTACVIPILLRPCDYDGAPFAILAMWPRNGEPVTKWADREDAFQDIIKGIREGIKQLSARP